MLLKTVDMYFLPTIHTIVFSDRPCFAHPYLSNRYVTILATLLRQMKLLVHYTDRFIPITVLCLLQSEYYVQTLNRQQKHAKVCVFYLF